ncbi:hypothetical protein [Patulibacter defluvii]|uniref:hypothetical protein n=1 Tax=Patulibacter defluvii TaxID=3095358 RepID=UPI002A75B3E5|nr:hypothetical protein [Patulibacter sp. DM4]
MADGRCEARERLIGDPSPGQRLVREIVAAAATPDDVRAALREAAATLAEDPIVGQPTRATAADRQYLSWQRARAAEPAADDPAADTGVAVRRCTLDWEHPPPLLELLRATDPATDRELAPVDGVSALHALFHGDADAAGPAPTGTILVDEQHVVPTRGAAVVAGHVAAGLRIAPARADRWTLIRTAPDPDLRATLLAHQALDPRGRLLGPPHHEPAAIEADRDEYVALLPLLTAAATRDQRLPVRRWPFRRRPATFAQQVAALEAAAGRLL